jgi:hypothetical protein
MRNNQPKNISGIFKKIKKSNVSQTEKTGVLDFSESLNTSFGMKLILCDDAHYLIKTNEINIFSGISDYIRILTTEIIENCKNSISDILITRSIDKNLLPEMSELQINYISIYIRNNITKIIENSSDDFLKQIILVFNTIQRPKWRTLIFPQLSNTETKVSLLFPFKFNKSISQDEYYILLEYDYNGKFLRLTVDSLDEPRLYLKRIPHRIVKNIDRQNFLQNIDKISEQIFIGMQRQCQNEQNEYIENPTRQSELFELLINSGLNRLSIIKYNWDNSKLSNLIIDKNKCITELFKKILLLLEDKTIIEVLLAGRIIEMINQNHKIYFDISRNGACLNISIDKQRKVKSPMEYLDRMPALKKTALLNSNSFNNIRILLIHHITTEILGFLKSLDILKTEHITTLFIKYKGVASEEILETIFTLPDDRFKFYSLQKIDTKDSVEGKFILSRRYSPIDNLKNLELDIRNKNMNFFKSMKLAAGHLFFKEAFKAKQLNQKIILIEDGGYITPEINELCLQNISLKNALNKFGIENKFDDIDYFPAQTELNTPLKLWLADVLYGSIEHTKNGFVSIKDVENKFGKLAYPCCTIAMSILKNSEEARECAISILNSIENIFNGIGKILSTRNVMVLGSSGFIGRNLMRQLSFRLIKGKLCGIDIAINKQSGDYIEKKFINELSDEIFLDIDLIIGMTGVSVMKKKFISKLLLYGKKQELFFSSGSTKTAEFEDLSNYLEELKKSENPAISDINIALNFYPIKDKQTGLVQGIHVRINFLNKNDKILFDYKDLYLLGDLMPINFLYYGVPTEIMDLIFAQLLKVTAGLVKNCRTVQTLPNKLLAIDFEIDENANLL